MSQIYPAPTGYTLRDPNPYAPDGSYDRTWTILTIDPALQHMVLQQRSPHGCYAVSMLPSDPHFDTRFADFIQYETDHGRKILLVSPQPMCLDFQTHYREAAVRPSDPRLLVHSTTLPTYAKIRADGCLKSPTRLRADGLPVHPVGLAALGEPEDYLDHIMLADGGVAPEIVVNSRLCAALNYDANAPYTPQARLYFDGHRMAADGILVRNLAAMVQDTLPLAPYLIKTVMAGDIPLPAGAEYWTPHTFSQAADAYMRGQYSS